MNFPDDSWMAQQFAQLHEEHHKIFRKLDKILKGSVRFSFSVGPVTNKQKGKTPMLEITITNEQQVKVTLNPTTEAGHPASLDGPPAWSVISGDSTVTPSDDGLSADLISANDPGDTDFLVKADADLGSGVQEISDVVRLHVNGAQAANLGLSAGDPTPKP